MVLEQCMREAATTLAAAAMVLVLRTVHPLNGVVRVDYMSVHDASLRHCRDTATLATSAGSIRWEWSSSPVLIRTTSIRPLNFVVSA
jgi:hypothetical protein